MIKFIKLNECGGNDISKVLVLNTSYIEQVSAGNKGKDTYIKLANKDFFFVKESLDEVLGMLQTDYSKAPMLVDKKLAQSLGLAK